MGSYWNHDGRHQRTYLKLHAKLVPASGRCDTLEGEMLRAASKLYHEAYNNGWGNNLSGPANFLRKHGMVDAEVSEYLDGNANVGRGGDLDEALLERMVDAVIVRARDARRLTPNEVDCLSMADPERFVPRDDEPDEEEEDDEDDALVEAGIHP